MFSLHTGNRYIGSQLEVTADFKTPETRLSQERKLNKRVVASVVRDTRTGKTHLKVVNALPAPLKLTVKGLKLRATAKTEIFFGQPADNSVIPVAGTLGSDDGLLSVPAYAVVAVEL